MSTEEASLRNKLELIRNEYQACRRKLDSKCEALLIVTRELDQCRSERDQFKLMADQLRDRCQTLKQQLRGPALKPLLTSDSNHYVALQSQLEVDTLKQKLADAEGDIKLLRERIAKERLGTSDEAMSTRYFPLHEREDLVLQLESSHEQFGQLEHDLKRVLDEKEELVTERDAFRAKYARLNVELNYILRGDERRVLDIDALCMENKYLLERLKQMDEEKAAAVAAVSKYKLLLERRKVRSILKTPASCDIVRSMGAGKYANGSSSTLSALISHKKMEQLLGHLASSSAAVTTALALPAPPPASSPAALLSVQASEDLRALAFVLLDSVNDKNLALSHQRKTNKILAGRIADLEHKLKTMELSGLCTIAGKDGFLADLLAEGGDARSVPVTAASAPLIVEEEVPATMSRCDDASCEKDDGGDALSLLFPELLTIALSAAQGDSSSPSVCQERRNGSHTSSAKVDVLKGTRHHRQTAGAKVVGSFFETVSSARGEPQEPTASSRTEVVPPPPPATQLPVAAALAENPALLPARSSGSTGHHLALQPQTPAQRMCSASECRSPSLA